MNDTIGGRLSDLIVNPRRLMSNVELAPRWWQAGLVVFVLIAAFTWLTMPIAAPEQVELMRDSKLAQMVPEEQWQQQYDEALDVPPVSRVLKSIGGGFTTWISMLVFGFVLGFFARMSGGQGTFKQALGIVSWGAVIPFGLAPLIKTPLVMATESVYRVNLGLAALLPDADPSSILFQILSAYGDFFTWWGLIVLVIGFERVFKLGRGAAAISVLLPWALLSLIPLGLALLFM